MSEIFSNEVARAEVRAVVVSFHPEEAPPGKVTDFVFWS